MKFLITCLVAIGICMPGSLLAGETPTNYLPTEVGVQASAFAGSGGANFGITSDPRLLIASSIQVITSLLATVFLIYGIWGGYQIFVSRGDADQISKAKSTIITAAAGVFLMLMSYSITLYITGSVQRATGIGIQDEEEEIDWSAPVESNLDTTPKELTEPPDIGKFIR